MGDKKVAKGKGGNFVGCPAARRAGRSRWGGSNAIREVVRQGPDSKTSSLPEKNNGKWELQSSTSSYPSGRSEAPINEDLNKRIRPKLRRRGPKERRQKTVSRRRRKTSTTHDSGKRGIANREFDRRVCGEGAAAEGLEEGMAAWVHTRGGEKCVLVRNARTREVPKIEGNHPNPYGRVRHVGKGTWAG